MKLGGSFKLVNLYKSAETKKEIGSTKYIRKNCSVISKFKSNKKIIIIEILF